MGFVSYHKPSLTEYLIVSWKASKAGEVFTWHHTDLTEKENQEHGADLKK